MTIDEIKKDLFINSEEVCGNTMVDLYEAQDCCDNSYEIGYSKAIDDFVKQFNIVIDEKCGTDTNNYFRKIVKEVAEQLKAGGKND